MCGHGRAALAYCTAPRWPEVYTTSDITTPNHARGILTLVLCQNVGMARPAHDKRILNERRGVHKSSETTCEHSLTSRTHYHDYIREHRIASAGIRTGGEKKNYTYAWKRHVVNS